MRDFPTYTPSQSGEMSNTDSRRRALRECLLAVARGDDQSAELLARAAGQLERQDAGRVTIVLPLRRQSTALEETG